MRPTTLASAALLAARPLVASQVGETVFRRADDEYWQQVCYPADYTEKQVPPCFSIDNIEAACMPNGTSPLAFAAHAQCMCGGSFFREWAGCQNCLFVHSQRSELEMNHYSAIMTAASQELCTGTPTAPWASVCSFYPLRPLCPTILFFFSGQGRTPSLTPEPWRYIAFHSSSSNGDGARDRRHDAARRQERRHGRQPVLHGHGQPGARPHHGQRHGRHGDSTGADRDAHAYEHDG